MKRLTILLALVLSLAVAGTGRAETRPRCQVRNPTPPTIVVAGKNVYLWGQVKNRCIDPVASMGTYACLEESHYPNFIDDSRVIECHANSDAPVLLVPHETDVFIAAKCDYTTVPRYYRISAYAWAVSLTGTKYDTRPVATTPEGRMASRPVSGRTVTSDGTVRFCDISKPNLNWRNQPW